MPGLFFVSCWCHPTGSVVRENFSFPPFTVVSLLTAVQFAGKTGRMSIEEYAKEGGEEAPSRCTQCFVRPVGLVLKKSASRGISDITELTVNEVVESSF